MRNHLRASTNKTPPAPCIRAFAVLFLCREFKSPRSDHFPRTFSSNETRIATARLLKAA